jgi:hypothetical protein
MKILLQHGSNGFEQLLNITNPIHAAYCARHGYTFRATTSVQSPVRSSMWEKVILLLQALREGCDTIIWLYADCLIVNPNIDLAAALADTPSSLPIGMVRFDPPYAVPGHFNTGAIYIKVPYEAIRRDLIDLFEDAWADWPRHHPWEDQNAINRTLAARTHIAAEPLAFKWNCTPNLPEPDPIVRAWHGHDLPTRISCMTEAVKQLPNL